MAEITPVTPLHPTIRPRRIEGDDKQRQEQTKQQQREDKRESKLDDDQTPHIDERV